MSAQEEAGRARAPADAAPAAPDASGAELRDRDARIIRELAREGEALVAFQGLKRRLDLHQQALARALRRLERDGLVAAGEEGYRLTEAGFDAVGAVGDGRRDGGARESLTVVQALLPPHVDAAQVEGHLAGRWFDGLRWYGRAEAPGETALIWHTEGDEATVRVRVAGGAFTLEVDAPPGRHGWGYGAARAVLGALAELYGLGGGEGAVSGLVAGAGVAG